ncbi:MAG: response regulator transcription factor [Oxalobacteraceae bacterium]|nr:MAG: response regulator transcription factor [Oxalobacteraceae bacterium]
MTAAIDEESEHSVARILIIADDLIWNKMLALHLHRCGFHVRFAMTYEEGRYLLLTSSFDVILLRMECSIIDEILRSKYLSLPPPSCHIVVMATNTGYEGPSRFLDNGADDYFHASYTPTEIASRLKAIQRRRIIGADGIDVSYRTKINQPSLRFCFNGWVLNCSRAELFAPSGVQVSLTKGEYCLLKMLVSCRGAVQTREALTYALKGEKMGGYYRTTDTAICRLRRKLFEYDSEELIKSVPKKGYKLVVTANHISDE